MIANSAFQSSAGTIHYEALWHFVHGHLNNAPHIKANSLITKSYLAIIASNEIG